KRCALHFVTDVVDADPGQAQAADAHREQHKLDREHAQAMAAVPPGESEHPPDQVPVGEFGSARLGHGSSTLTNHPRGARNLSAAAGPGPRGHRPIAAAAAEPPAAGNSAAPDRSAESSPAG